MPYWVPIGCEGRGSETARYEALAVFSGKVEMGCHFVSRKGGECYNSKPIICERHGIGGREVVLHCVKALSSLERVRPH